MAHETVCGFSNQENDVGNRKRKTLKIRSYCTSTMKIIEEVAIVQVKLLVDAHAKCVAINIEYGGVKVSEKWSYLNDGKWQNSRNYVIGVLVAIIMVLLALEVEYVE